MMDKTYNPKDFEKRIYENWLKQKYFASSPDDARPKYSILMPPPNITGHLHVGHAMNHTLPDVYARYKRLNGFNVEWLPGTDHAAIATEAKVVAKLAKQGRKKEDLTREEFEAEMQAWYKEYGGFIVEQLKSLGIMADWDKLAFTRDETRNRAVTHAFVEWWKKGYIYRGERLTNWCPNCNTSISDIEVEYHSKQAKLYYIKYFVVEDDGMAILNGDNYLTVATTRPETLFGDLAVAVNPNDDRYKKFIGKQVVLPIVNKKIPVIADEYVDISFGTGALKVTPSHDINDYELGKKHNLGFLQVINKDGSLNELCGQFEGLKGQEAREKVADYLDKTGLLVKAEDYLHNVGCCERCKTPIESLITEQWFVSMQKIAKETKKHIDNNEVNIQPDFVKAKLYTWLNDIQDWCISRQLWTGHRIPVYYCHNCGHMYAAEQNTPCPKCKSSDNHQDPDVLDTWFSSGIWPISTLNWPEHSKGFDTYYPFDLVVTARDIITFWIARMLFMCIDFEGVVPFYNCITTGLVVDDQGRKMSKNLGNGIEPQDVIKEYGTDALRFALLYGTALETDSRFGTTSLENARKFINKIWNASRFVEMNLNGKTIKDLNKRKLQLADKWILTKLNEVILKVTKLTDNYNANLALNEIHDFAWLTFCDYYIEFSKPNMQSQDSDVVNTTASVLKYVLGAILKMLHPYIPFVTEEIYTNIFGESIMLADYPQANKEWNFIKECEQMDSIMELTHNIREIRTTYKVDAKKVLNANILVRKTKDNLQENITYLQTLTQTKITEITTKPNNPQDMLISTPYYLVYLHGDEIVDITAEKARLNAEITKVNSDIQKLEGILSNAGFVARAPGAVIEKYKKELAENNDKLANLKQSLSKLK
ncbi:MAG: valine--tRNA ligase [Clostridia bacterium]|nr:valine--tRNA ligase [Clostridia bacterium]